MRLPGNTYIDNPSRYVMRTVISYDSISTANGNVLGTTIVDAQLANEPSYGPPESLVVKVLSGNAAGQARAIAAHPAGTNTLTVASPFTDNAGAVVQIVAGTAFVVMSIEGGGAPAPVLSPSIGLWMFGECDAAMVASQTVLVLTNLAGFPDDIFNQEFWVQVIHNVSAPGTAPEREIRRVTDYVGATGTFTTDAFSANVEATDLVAVFHESIMSIEILGFGTLDTSSTTVPADSARAGVYAWENDDYFRGCLLMPTEGNCRFQPRPIGSYISATGVFNLAEPFSQAPGLVDYILIGAAYPSAMHESTDLIFALVNAIFTMKETGGTITTDGTEQDLYRVATPAGIFKPVLVQIDTTNMQAADAITIRERYQIIAGGGPILNDEVVFAGVQAIPLKDIELRPNRFGIQVTIQRTAGADRDYDWAVFYED